MTLNIHKIKEKKQLLRKYTNIIINIVSDWKNEKQINNNNDN